MNAGTRPAILPDSAARSRPTGAVVRRRPALDEPSLEHRCVQWAVTDPVVDGVQRAEDTRGIRAGVPREM